MESSDLRVMRRVKEKSLKNKSEHLACPKRKRRRFADKQKLLQSTFIKVVPIETADDDYEKDPMIRVYSEDSAYVDTKEDNHRISFR